MRHKGKGREEKKKRKLTERGITEHLFCRCCIERTLELMISLEEISESRKRRKNHSRK